MSGEEEPITMEGGGDAAVVDTTTETADAAVTTVDNMKTEQESSTVKATSTENTSISASTADDMNVGTVGEVLTTTNNENNNDDTNTLSKSVEDSRAVPTSTDTEASMHYDNNGPADATVAAADVQMKDVSNETNDISNNDTVVDNSTITTTATTTDTTTMDQQQPPPPPQSSSTDVVPSSTTNNENLQEPSPPSTTTSSEAVAVVPTTTNNTPIPYPPTLPSSITSVTDAAAAAVAAAAIKKKNKLEKKNKLGKKRKGELGDDGLDEDGRKKPGPKKGKKKKKLNDESRDKPKKKRKGLLSSMPKFSPAQAAVKDMMRQLLEEDKYSQKGSIVDTDSSDEEDDERTIYAIATGATNNVGSGSVNGTSGSGSSSKRGNHGGADTATITMLRLDRATITKAMRKRLRIEEMRGMMDSSGANKKRANNVVLLEDHNDNEGLDLNEDDDGKDIDSGVRGGRKKKRKKNKRSTRSEFNGDIDINGGSSNVKQDDLMAQGVDNNDSNDLGANETSIFGQTAGQSNATWVECDKCKKWRRLRGVVDAKKLPAKWYCSMNKKDPERSKCSAPEEEYDAMITPENATEQRTRKHLMLWVKRLKTNEKFESTLPTMTRGKKRNTTSAKEPYEWIRCCNPSCGKWRALLRSMDAASVIDAAKNGEWYCVLNTWDEKTASCAAPQENLPVIGCPPWVMRNDI